VIIVSWRKKVELARLKSWVTTVSTEGMEIDGEKSEGVPKIYFSRTMNAPLNHILPKKLPVYECFLRREFHSVYFSLPISWDTFRKSLIPNERTADLKRGQDVTRVKKKGERKKKES
jgi:hypothetical protein